ncbi:MAG: M48 family metalloprotease, partial [Pseudohongiellaceae bacterium]
YGGTFFGNLIKAAVSRQREFLADASAVQFTRNPYGISGALKKIGGYSGGSKINSIDASEISHMLFEEGVATGFSSLFATHPPLKERIKRIDPHWQGDFADASRPAGNQAETPGMAGFSSSGADGGSAVDAIGKPGPGHMELAGQQMRRIPAILIEQAHTSLGASVLMYALVMDFDNRESLLRQQQILDEELDRAASG